MILLFIGPQGSGKGTQARIISKKLNLAHISMGDLLREVKEPLKQKVDFYINKGNLVPNNLTIKIIKQRIKHPDCKKGFILDGFPRNLKQAEIISKFLDINKVIEISISDNESVKRLTGRWNCKKCGISYNLITQPKPKQNHICDVCKSKLYQRKDDKDKEAIQKRLKLYHKETEPILKKYDSIKINGEQSIEKITKDILKELG